MVRSASISGRTVAMPLCGVRTAKAQSFYSTAKDMPISDLFEKSHDESKQFIDIKPIVFRQRFWSAQANGTGISRGQRAAIRRSARILHSFFTCALDSRYPRGRWNDLPK